MIDRNGAVGLAHDDFEASAQFYESTKHRGCGNETKTRKSRLYLLGQDGHN